MVFDWLSGGKGAGLKDLIARRKYDKAIESLKAEFQAGKTSPHVRLQLADLMVLAGREKEAIPVLVGLANEFVRDGFAAKAIAVLKKIQKIQPGRVDVDLQLAALIKKTEKRGRSAPAAGPAGGLEIGMEEIGFAPNPRDAASAAPPGAAEAPPAEAATPGELDTGELAALGDDLLNVIESVLQEPRPATPSSPAGASPLFNDFSEPELLAVMRGLELLSYEPGDIIISEGEPGDSVFVLTSGVAKAFVRDAQGRNALAREMPEGSFFGEVSILRGSPRTATVTAKTRCELLELDRATLDQICTTHPRVREVLTHFYEQRTAHPAP